MQHPDVTTDARAFARRLRALPRRGEPAMRACMLVDPVGFRVASQSAADNAYMDLSARIDPGRALQQHHAVVDALHGVGVPTVVFPGRVGLDDGIFPNNVFATTPGRLVVARMRHPVRQREAAREDVRRLLTQTFGYGLHDLSSMDAVGELTGVLALDRVRGAAICGLTSRAEAAAVPAMHDALGLALTLATPLIAEEYHLNMVCVVLAGRACVIWDGAFIDPAVPEALDEAFEGAVLHLSRAEKDAFAANCLAVTSHDVLMSATALPALRPDSRRWFDDHGFRLHPVDVSELEKGGGSLRCLLAELF